MPRPVRRIAFVAAALLWVGGVAAGFTVLVRYEASSGAPASIASHWPASAPIERAADRPTLLVFVHPQCPCTAATLGELARLLAHCGDRVRTLVVCYADPALGAEWVRSANWNAAAAIPGVGVIEDPLGATARAFGARTSGQACLYDRDGALLFEGGITASRGHSGDNAGEDALQGWLLDGASRCSRSAVFGCSLEDPVEGDP